MFTIQFFRFNGENNTIDKRPFLGDDDDYRPLYIMSGDFKTDVDFTNPVINVTESPEVYFGGDEYSPMIFAKDVNYAYISDVKRWYFVRRKSAIATNGTKNLWLVELHLDVLYTFKNDVYATHGIFDRTETIGGTSHYIPDNMKAIRNDDSYEFVTPPTNFNKFRGRTNQDGQYYTVIAVGTPYANATQRTLATGDLVASPFNDHIDSNEVLYTIYSLNQDELRAFSNKILTNSILDNWKLLLYKDPIDAIISVRAYPVRNPSYWARPIGHAPDTIHIGTYDTEVTGKVLASSVQEFTEAYGTMFPEEFGDYRDYAPYKRIDLFLPYIGFVNIDPVLVTGKFINFKYIVDFTTGAFTCLITTRIGTDEKVLYTFNGQMGTALPLSSSNRAENATAQVYSGIAAGAGLAAGIATNGIGFAIAGLASGAANAANAMREHINHGNIGDGYLSYVNGQSIFAIVTKVNEVGPGMHYSDSVGYPNRTSGTVAEYQGTGYVKMLENHVTASGATDAERDEIETLLKSGVIA